MIHVNFTKIQFGNLIKTFDSKAGGQQIVEIDEMLALSGLAQSNASVEESFFRNSEKDGF